MFYYLKTSPTLEVWANERERPEIPADIKDSMDNKYYLFDYKTAIEKWLQSCQRYQIKEEEKDKFEVLGMDITSPLDYNRCVKEGIHLKDAEIEVRKECINNFATDQKSMCGYQVENEPCPSCVEFAFLVDKAVKETGETQDQLWDELIQEWHDASLDDYKGKDVIGYLKSRYEIKRRK